MQRLVHHRDHHEVHLLPQQAHLRQINVSEPTIFHQHGIVDSLQNFKVSIGVKARGSHRAAIAVKSQLEHLYKSNHNETYQGAKKGHPDGVPPIFIPDNPDINW